MAAILKVGVKPLHNSSARSAKNTPSPQNRDKDASSFDELLSRFKDNPVKFVANPLYRLSKAELTRMAVDGEISSEQEIELLLDDRLDYGGAGEGPCNKSLSDQLAGDPNWRNFY